MVETRQVKAISLALTGAVLTAFLLGCAAGGVVGSGYEALENGNYPRAQAYFEQALKDDPGDVRARVGLGELYYKQKKYDQAENELRQARELEPDDARASLYLGLTHEAQDEYSQAATVYESYLLYDDNSDLARQMKGRLYYVRDQDLRQQVRQALQFEKSGSVQEAMINSVGVMPFLLGDATDASLKPLATGLAAAINHDLSYVGEIELVERQKLSYLLEELQLVEDSLVDESSAPRLGRIVRAQNLVSGKLGAAGQERLAINTFITRTSDASSSTALATQEEFDRLMQLQKQITFAIIDSLGIKLTPEEKDAIAKIPTESFEAFLAYSRGLDQLDHGNHDAASEQFARALSLDPGFEQAAQLQQESELLSVSAGPVGEFESIAFGSLGQPLEFEQPPTENVFDIGDTPIPDPRDDDDPVVKDGQVSVGGSIR
jgi:tetratricopeptide (TPR) repeat protein